MGAIAGWVPSWRHNRYYLSGHDSLNQARNMTARKAQTCDGCSACCHSVGHPPFLLEWEDGVPHSIEGADSQADYQRLFAAPAEAQAAYVASRGAIDSPCT